VGLRRQNNQAENAVPPTPATAATVAPAIIVVLIDFDVLSVVISASDAVKPQVSVNKVVAVLMLTKVVKSTADTVVACSMLSSALATTVLVARFRRRVKTV
jgi:hypothetical protein